jgi:large subunit ribosomal protein L17
MGMRHRVAGRTLGRKSNHRIAMFRNMAVSLFTHGQITTTIPKAKAVKPFVEKLITTAKKGDLAARRRIASELGYDRIMVRDENDKELVRSKKRENRPGGYAGKLLSGPKIVKHVVDEVAPRYADRSGGYTRIIKLARHRIGDGADLCILQLVSDEQSGPQVRGSYSRRRQQANGRTEFAADRRKGGKAATDATDATDATATDAAPGDDNATAFEESPADNVANPGDESAGPTADEQKNA